jgi:hypothetical protein
MPGTALDYSSSHDFGMMISVITASYFDLSYLASSSPTMTPRILSYFDLSSLASSPTMSSRIYQILFHRVDRSLTYWPRYLFCSWVWYGVLWCISSLFRCRVSCFQHSMPTMTPRFYQLHRVELSMIGTCISSWSALASIHVLRTSLVYCCPLHERSVWSLDPSTLQLVYNVIQQIYHHHRIEFFLWLAICSAHECGMAVRYIWPTMLSNRFITIIASIACFLWLAICA